MTAFVPFVTSVPFASDSSYSSSSSSSSFISSLPNTTTRDGPLQKRPYHPLQTTHHALRNILYPLHMTAAPSDESFNNFNPANSPIVAKAQQQAKEIQRKVEEEGLDIEEAKKQVEDTVVYPTIDEKESGTEFQVVQDQSLDAQAVDNITDKEGGQELLQEFWDSTLYTKSKPWTATMLQQHTNHANLTCLDQLNQDATAFLDVDIDHPSTTAIAPPTYRDELYRFTDLSSLWDHQFNVPTNPPQVSNIIKDAVMVAKQQEALATVFVHDGFLDLDTSILPPMQDYPGLHIFSLAQPHSTLSEQDKIQLVQLSNLGKDSIQSKDYFATLNAAMANDLIVVRIRENTILDKPIQFLFHTSHGTAVHPRIVVIAEKGAQAQIMQHHILLDHESTKSPSKPIFQNVAITVDCHPQSIIQHHLINQLPPKDAFLVSNVYVAAKQSAEYKIVNVAVGAQVARTSVYADMVGEGATIEIRGLGLANQSQCSDINTRITHKVKHCNSKQLQKMVAAGNGTTVFRGLITVEHAADFTKSEQLCRSLLLSGNAECNAMPQLEVSTDEVEATHGATVSDIRDEELFYCLARGIPKDIARQLLISSFANEVLQQIPYELINKKIQADFSLLQYDKVDRKAGARQFSSI